MFAETFLRDKNQDCLEQVLSFLTCNELANVGTASKTLHQIIFQANEEEGDISMIWQGAEHALTNSWDERQFIRDESGRIGSNGREHCRLFATASKAAKAFEMSDEIRDDRVMVDGILSNLVNVREYDAASVAEQKAIGDKETRTIEEEVSDPTRKRKFTDVKLDDDFKKACRERKLRRDEEIERLKKLTPPDEPNNHGVFVRVARVASGEVISQGFCFTGQKYPWFFGLDLAREVMPYGTRQGLQISLDFDSLKRSEEMQSFQEFYFSAGQAGAQGIRDMTIGFNITAVMIDKRNRSVQCLFQQDQTKEIRYSGLHHGLGLVHGLKNYQFPLESKWGRDSIQLGSSMEYDRYYLSYTFSLNVAPSETGGCLMVPSLDVDIQHDTTVSDQAMMGAMNRFVASRYNIDTGAE
mmetsp:Transcript_46422/g.112532  ORF Transcript_46422/g.112532 Transcript_46422/m.112532 type:complete len:411 (-) Transcript_46422:31-1263(-)